jgi:hypothetical protein
MPEPSKTPNYKKFWIPFFVGLAAAALAAAVVIWLLGVFQKDSRDGPRAVTRSFLKQLLAGKVAAGFKRPQGIDLKKRWEAVARHGVLDRELQAGGRAAVYVVVPADKVPGVNLAAVKRRLRAMQKKLAPAVGAAARVDLIGRARREAERGRLLFFIQLRRLGRGWGVVYPRGLVLVGSQ